jgi:phage gp29-like protein
MKNPFSTPKIPTAQELVTKSQGIMSVFTEALKKLQESNEELAEEAVIRQDTIAILTAEERMLTEQIKRNEGYASKISAFTQDN